jgi:hypothetical protein
VIVIEIKTIETIGYEEDFEYIVKWKISDTSTIKRTEDISMSK